MQDFVSLLEVKQVTVGETDSKVDMAREEVFSISMEDLNECLASLSSAVLAREKECYQL